MPTAGASVSSRPTAMAPRRWRSAAPLWGDASFASVAPALRSGCVVAAVRSASIGMPIEPSASAPFTDGQWLLSHNGLVDRAVLPLSAEVPAGRVDRRQRAAGGADLRPRTGRAWRHHRRGRRGRPQRQAEHLGGQRISTARHHLGRHACRCCAATTAWCWPANHTTTTPTWQEIPDRHLVEVADCSARCRRPGGSVSN